MGQVLAILMNKGGVGKTTTAVHLAAAMAEKGKHVLLMDLDMQANASLSFGVPRGELRPSMANVLIEGEDLEKVIRKSIRPNLDLATADLSLVHFDVNAFDQPDNVNILRRTLDAVRDNYDVIILDGAPGFNLLSTNIFRAADAYIVPVTLDFLAAHGITNLDEALREIEEGTGVSSRRLGILVTCYEPWLKLSKEFSEALEQTFGSEVFSIKIPRTVKVREATGHGKLIFEYDRQCSAAAAYRLLTDEVMERLGIENRRGEGARKAPPPLQRPESVDEVVSEAAVAFEAPAGQERVR